MNEQSIVEIETKLAYLEDTVHTLNDVVTRQQHDIERLTARCERLETELRENQSKTGAGNADEKPPHY